MKKYTIILFSILLLAGSLTNAQTIKRSKQKTEQTQNNNNSKKSSKTPSKSSKVDNQKPNSSTTTRDRKTQKAKPSSSRPLQSTTRPTEPTAYDVTFTCNVSNADMYIDNNDYGKPNGTRTLKTGSHQVKIVAEGYDDLTMTIQVNAESTSFDFKMTKESYVAKVETININGVSFDMVFVEGGTFTMGATNEQGIDADSDEKPSHQVTLSNYYISQFEVTQKQWRAVMENNPSNNRDNPNNPVECVSWNDCQEFITKLNRLTGKRFRLPTEAEWEYAARGGNKSQNYKYSGSNTLDMVAWYGNNSQSATHSVGSKAPNELGLYDMSGNVEEWCQDWYSSFSSATLANPSGAFSGSYRIGRGGNKDSSARNCRVSYRGNYGQFFTLDNLGLRLAASSL